MSSANLPMRKPIEKAFVFMLATLLFTGTSVLAAEKTFEETIPVNSDVDFSIDSHRGGVEIRTGDVDNIEITAVIRHDRQEAVDDVEIVIYRSRDRVTVDVDYDEPVFRFSSLFDLNSYEYPDIQFHIVLPDQASLSIDSHRSTLNVAAPAGRVDIMAHRGRGRITGIRNDISLDTHRGNFDLEIANLQDVRVETHRGDIDLDISEASNFSIAAEVHRGNLSMRGRNVSIHRHDRQSYLDYNEGDGSNYIRVDAHRGDIRLNFLN